MTNAQTNTAVEQASNIVSMMSVEQKQWFSALDADSQFLFICAALAATA